MDEKKRVKKDLNKLCEIIKYFESRKFSKKYVSQYEYAKNYEKDAIYYYEKCDYFTSFGCANYAYGILEGILLMETGKAFHKIKVK